MRNRYIAIAIVAISSLLLSGCTSAYDTSYYYAYDKGNCYTNRFEGVDDTLDISVLWRYDRLYLKWEQYTEDDFQGYYITRSTSNSCPYYYVGGDYLEYNGRDYENYFSDKTAESGEEYYYRVCVKTTDRLVKCGSVMKVELY